MRMQSPKGLGMLAREGLVAPWDVDNPTGFKGHNLIAGHCSQWLQHGARAPLGLGNHLCPFLIATDTRDWDFIFPLLKMTVLC